LSGAKKKTDPKGERKGRGGRKWKGDRRVKRATWREITQDQDSNNEKSTLSKAKRTQ